MRRRRKLVIVAGAVIVALSALLYIELRTSWIQSRYFARVASELSFDLEAGPNSELPYPEYGPYDTRRGFTRIRDLTSDLESRGFEVDSQARLSPALSEMIAEGLYPVYDEKTRAGLTILDHTGRTVYERRIPERFFQSFEDVPALIVETLLYIENRELLDPHHPNRNPAVEWDRLARSVLQLGARRLGAEGSVAGASTLATQIEKFRHSPGGYTTGSREKLRQMKTATIRAYMDGEATLGRRRQIVLDYLNSVPLSAIQGYGEVIGLQDGLWAWYGVDPQRTVEALRDAGETATPADRGAAYRQVLSLLLAQRRPSFYLASADGRKELERLTDAHLGRLEADGVIDPGLRASAAESRLLVLPRSPALPTISFVDQKGVNAVRRHLLGLLDTDRLYELDRYDLTVRSTLDAPAQAEVTETLRRLADPEFVRASGLDGFRLLGESDPARVIYSFVLYERGPEGNLVRVQTDNLDAPFDVNQAGRLELGSTAKLRTLVNYLEIVERLHGELKAVGPDSLAILRAEFPDPISQWAMARIAAEPEVGLETFLELAMDRTYSASPNERFFTGGGSHVFANFDDTYDYSVITLRTAFQQSVNLVFVRLMRDIERFYRYRIPGSSARILEDPGDPRRQEYLQRFADREGSLFISRFYAKHREKSFDESVELVVGGRNLSPQRLAWAFRSMDPDADLDAFDHFLRDRASSSYNESAVESLYRRSDPADLSLADRGYLASVHPLELWLVDYLRTHPEATRTEVLEASAGARQEVYRWLFNTRRKGAQDQRIRVLLEVESFLEITRAWRRLGYPFENLVPSYGTSIGSSGDRPGALAELVGILVNDGIRLPTVLVTDLDFARATPYSTVMSRRPVEGERVLSPAVAAVARAAMLDVVENGTAGRVKGALTAADGTRIPIGGKTGTGNNQYKQFGRGGVLLDARTLNRTSTFVFFLGDRFYGVVTAYVPGEEAAEYRFTSALPVQILRMLAPELAPLVTGDAGAGTEPEAAVPPLRGPDQQGGRAATETLRE